MSFDSNRNLLFGILALQMDFISREQLVAATSKWLMDKSKPIDDILIVQGAFSEADQQLLASLVARHIENHEGDAEKSLAAVSSIGSLREELKSLGDSQIDATLSAVARGHEKSAVAATIDTSVDQGAQTLEVGEKSSGGARFRILRPHARGGLGEVSVAQDTELSREVALKEIQSRFADDQNSRSRFVLEAEVTGGLEHPGIVPVYGLGQYKDGRPYYAMRFIRGDSLKEAADRFHKTEWKDDSERTLELRKLLGRFVDVCNAIEYAHSRGVLHRDLKPGNIMLGKYGETLVVDWGLAKLKGRDDDTKVEGEAILTPSSGSGSAPTQMGSAIGTPAYMPPEQAAGQLDELGPASDVYSLGATLYYLLTGRQPIEGESLGDVFKKVQSGDFPAPRTIQPDIPKPLEAICLRAMATKSKDRYVSPQALADDGERFLADEPVSAFAEPLAVKARRWVRKHQTLTATTAAVVLVSVVGLGIFTTVVSGKNAQLTKLNTTLDRTNSELADKNVALAEAKQRETTAREVAEANEHSAREQSQLALTTLASVVQDIEYGLRNLSGGGDIRRRLLKTSLAKLENVAIKYVQQAAVDHETMWALFGLSDVVLEFGVEDMHDTASGRASISEHSQVQQSAVKLANIFFRRAHQIAEKLAVDDPANAEAQHNLFLSYNNIGDVQLKLGDSAAALASYQKGLQIAEKLAADHLAAQHDVSTSHARIGDVQLKLGDSAAALASHQRSLEIREKLAEDYPDDAKTQRALSVLLNNIGNVQLQLGDSGAALASHQRSLDIFEKLAADDPANAQVQRDLSISHQRIGDVQLQSGDSAAALASYQKSLEIAEKLAANDPGNAQAQSGLSVFYNKIGKVQRKLGDSEAALASHQKGLEIIEKLAADDPANAQVQRDLSISYNMIGTVQFQSGDSAAALASYQKSLEIADKLAADDPANAQAQGGPSIPHEGIGDVQFQSGDSGAALASYQKSLLIREKLAANDPADAQLQRFLSVSYNRIGDVQLKSGDSAAALASYQKGLQIREKLATNNPANAQAQRDLFISHHRIAVTHEASADWDDAAAEFSRGSKVLAQMIEREQLVQFAKHAKAEMDYRELRAQGASVAMGDWDQLLKQPTKALPVLLEMRAVQFSKQSRHTEAAQAASKLRELKNATGNQLYNAACVLSLRAASIKAPDSRDLTPEQTKQRQIWTADSLATLKQAIAEGYDDFDHMQKDSDLTILRDLPEFKALIPKNHPADTEKPGE